MDSKKIVIKLSSGLLVRDQKIQQDWLVDLGGFVADIGRGGYQIWLVTSGARALARHGNRNPQNHIEAMQGQKQMVKLYQEAFGVSNLKTREILLAKDDFNLRDNYLAIRAKLHTTAKQGIVALINDLPDKAISTRQFGDNDEIAGLVASMVDAQRLVLASTVEGVLRPDGSCLPEVPFGDKTWTEYVSQTKSEHGTGGMLLKCRAAEHSAHRGVEAVICDGTRIQNVQAASTGQAVGTRFAADRRISAKKRWILDKKDFAAGAVYVDDGLARIVEQGKSASLLTVGVTSVGGDFLENDIVAIKHGSKVIGFGETSLDMATAQRAIDGRKSKLLIHYDKYARIKL